MDDLVEKTQLGRDEFLFLYCAAASADRCFDVLEEAVDQRHFWVVFVPIWFRTHLPEVIKDPRWGGS